MRIGWTTNRTRRSFTGGILIAQMTIKVIVVPLARRTYFTARHQIGDLLGIGFATQVRIQYGGSVKSSSAAGLLSQEDIDGLLVGGASLQAEEFAAIVRAKG